MKHDERQVLLAYVAEKCSEDPTLPADLFKAITAGLVEGLKSERSMTADLAYTLISVVSDAETKPWLHNYLVHRIHPLQKGFAALLKFFEGAPIEGAIQKYIEEKPE